MPPMVALGWPRVTAPGIGARVTGRLPHLRAPDPRDREVRRRRRGRLRRRRRRCSTRSRFGSTSWADHEPRHLDDRRGDFVVLREPALDLAAPGAHRRSAGSTRCSSLLSRGRARASPRLPVAFSEYVLHQHSPLAYNISGNIVGSAFGTVWRFWSFKRWVFLEPEPDAPRTPRTRPSSDSTGQTGVTPWRRRVNERSLPAYAA